jgi:predicted Zn-dependent protease
LGKRAVDAAPGSSNAHFQYAVALRTRMQQVSKMRAMMSLGDYKRELERAIELDPRNTDAREEQIGFYSEAPGIAGGSVERARELAQQLQQIDRHRGMYMLARVERQAGQPERALELYRALLAERAEDPIVRSTLANLLLDLERWNEADEQFARLASSNDPRMALPAVYQRARTRIVGRYEPEAAVAFLKDYLARAAADSVPPPSAAWWRLGNAYELLGQTPDARQAYEEALRLNPDDKQAKDSLAALPKG